MHDIHSPSPEKLGRAVVASRCLALAAFIAAAVSVSFDPGQAASSTAGQPAEGQTGLSVELGEHDYRTYCAACHGVGGAGDGTVAEFLTIPAPDLTKLKKMNGGIFPRERILEVIDGRAAVKVHGPRDMPVWGDWFMTEARAGEVAPEAREIVVQDRIDALIAYIETLQEN